MRKLFFFLIMIIGILNNVETQCPESVLDYSDKLLLRTFTEGNFTGSGNKEIIAFYQTKNTLFIDGNNSKENFFINKVFCFILGSRDSIKKTYSIPFSTDQYNKAFNIDKMPLEKLGKRIPFGAVGDFNSNGFEELYLYSLDGFGMNPVFIEFNGTKFVNILNYESQSTALFIKKASTQKKEIFFYGEEATPNKDIVFIWDSKKSMYRRIQ